MRKASIQVTENDLRPEYDLSRLTGGVRGKYYLQAKAGTNLVLVEPDLARAFPNQASVNSALRLLLSAANAATAGGRERRSAPNKRVQRKRSARR